MEEYIVLGIMVVFGLGYLGLAAAVGKYASNRGWSFLLFFGVSLVFNPVLGFFGVVILDAVMGAAGADSLSEGAKNLTEKGKQAIQQQGMNDPRSEPGTEPAPPDERGTQDEGASEEEPVSQDGPVTRRQQETTSEPSSSDESVSPEETEAPVDFSSIEGGTSADEPDPTGDSLEETYAEDAADRGKEGKVRCDTCYSLVEESASECPACGTDLDSGGFF